MISSNTPWFPAILRSMEGEVLAEGEASVLKEDHAVTFTSDFVPLYPLGTQLEIMRIYKGKEVHQFIGKVYLSDKKLMRLVSVEDKLLPGSEEVYCGNMNFPATLTRCKKAENKRGFFFAKAKNEPDPQPIPVTIIELTWEQMVFATVSQEPFDQQPFEENERFLMQTQKPLPLRKDTVIEVQRSLLFGGKPIHLCRFPLMSKGDRDLLHAFLIQYNQQHNKLF